MTAPAAALRRVRLADLTPDARRAIVERDATASADVRGRAREIVTDVQRRGDDAVREYHARYGGGPAATDVPLRIPADRLRAACDALAPDLRGALEHMAANIERFHRAQVPAPGQWVETQPGIRVGRVWRALDRVAAYVPGAAAAYPSSLLMSVIPARLAGVREFVVATPAGDDGTISPALLGAAGLMGADEVYAMGGAQAIAALAFGTASVPPVDKIVGPGNAWVTAAKLEVFGRVAIDMPAGPSEVMVLADASADATHVASDLLSQAEHGPDSPAILVTDSTALADAVEREVGRLLERLPRQELLRRSIGSGGLIVEVLGRDDAIDFVNQYAPEHLSVVVRDDDAVVDRIRHAGSVFVGAFAPESAGDYATGSNHVLPTGRLARSFGPLSVESFGHWMQVQRVTRAGLEAIRETVGVVARAEGLIAHREAVEARFVSPGAGDARSTDA